jgi:hypothetical protein
MITVTIHRYGYFPPLACLHIQHTHGIFLVFHEGCEQSSFQRTLACMLAGLDANVIGQALG